MHISYKTRAILLAIATFTLSLTSCSRSSVKDGINKAGDVAGQAAGEFVEGTAHGIEKSFELQPTLSPDLQAKGLALGSYDVSSDSSGDAAYTDNLLTLYVIFNEAYSGPLTCKIFDHKQLEMGRSTVEATGRKGEARYIEFVFDARANIDSDTKVTLE